MDTEKFKQFLVDLDSYFYRLTTYTAHTTVIVNASEVATGLLGGL